MDIIRIDSEKAAWDTLEGLVSGKLKAEDILLDLDDLRWTRVYINFKGKIFDRTVTASIMSGMIELQDDIYRAAARVLKGDGRITRLTDQEKRDLELVFSVRKGSSEFLASAANSLAPIGKAVEKLSGKQSLIAILVLLLLLFGTIGGHIYLSHVETMHKIEAEQKGRDFDLQERKDLYDFISSIVKEEKEKADLINRAIRMSKSAKDISAYSDHAVGEILKRSGTATEVQYQGLNVDKDTISQITSHRRARSTNISIKGTYLVTAVETDDTSNYKVHLDSIEDGTTIVAELEDPLARSRYQNAIQRAEWNHSPVVVHIVGRLVGENIRDAKITRAYTPRKKK